MWYNFYCLDEQFTGALCFKAAGFSQLYIVGKAPSMCGLTSSVVRLGNGSAHRGRFAMGRKIHFDDNAKPNKWMLRKIKFDVQKRYKDDELKQPGIYAIVNLQNGHIYIGQSKNMYHRRVQHFMDLRHERHANTYLQNAYNYYGAANFRFTVVEFIEPEQLDEREQYWIEREKPTYNIRKNVFECRTINRRENCPDGYYQNDGEKFIRPEWHRWVYGGERHGTKVKAN